MTTTTTTCQCGGALRPWVGAYASCTRCGHVVAVTK